MTRRYSIMVIQHGAKQEIELCQVDRDPHGIAQAAARKNLRISGGMGRRAINVPKYDSVRVIDHAPDRVEGGAPDQPQEA